MLSFRLNSFCGNNIVDMSYIMILGLAAACCTTIAFVPQVLKTWRTKSANDLSLGMYLIFTTGVILWLIYGLIRWDIPIIAANGITLILALIILWFKAFFDD